MAKRCDNCRHWVETVFLGSSASGYGCWEGVCQHHDVPRPGPGQRDRHNLMLACPKFEEGAHPRSLSGVQAACGVPASEYLAKVEADPRRAAALQRARDRTPGVDACATCGGARDGVPGNENLVDGKPMCDYCHSDLIRTHGVKGEGNGQDA